jgi:hypothetical protein
METGSRSENASALSRRSFVRGAATAAAAVGTSQAIGSAQGATPDEKAKLASASSSSSSSSNSDLPIVFAYGYDKEPYPLDPGPHLFLDWRYVLPGRTRYLSPDGKGTTSAAEGLHGKVTIDQIRVLGDQSPYGVRLQAQPPTKLASVLPNDKPWEYSLCYPTLGYFEGKYRMWYEAITPYELGAQDVLCYAESTDGVNWEKPELGLVEFNDNKRNNIVYNEKIAGHGFHGVGVCYDPSAPAEQRYKAIYNSQVAPDLVARLKAQSPGSMTPLGESKRLLIYCAASPDGIHWKALPQPLMSQMSDTGTTMYYDEVLKRYVGYFRMSFMNRRVIGRSDGATVDAPWPAPESIVWTDPGEVPSNDYYTNGKSLYPGTRTAHFLFPTIYTRFSDSSVIRMLTSLDGKQWMIPPGGESLIEPGPEGSWDGGCVFGGNGLAEIAGDRVAFPYIGYGLPHKFPRLVRCGEVGLATWPKHRLCAVVADEEGEFHTQPFKLSGNTLRLNFHVKRDGFLKVEVLGHNGRKLDDCDPLFGDAIGRQVTWKGQSAIRSTGGGEDVTFRFRLRSAKLFSFEVV